MVEKFLGEGTGSTAEFDGRTRFLKATVFEQVLDRCAFIPVLPVLFAAESVVKGLGFFVGEESAWHPGSRVRPLVQRM